ncbi:type IV pilus modification PilV family protein [Demequina aurantiaca]|uniref:type IV pilus modification PilV family protein n=1 Tax=Demequina aurantiaca TaxID=676200 RepID=UPI00078421A1|nr:prepilin-type N-terminal cleavage/methylation domain-containing protein [Demequina aurantiaca]
MDTTQASSDATESTSGADSGFTLVEVIWALFLLGLIAMGALALFIHGVKTTAHLQRNQAAVSLASGAMDVARSVSGGPVNAVGTSGVIKGRSETAVKAVWNDATALEPSDTADMTIAWDPEGGLTPDKQWVPVRTTQTVDNQEFTIDTLIGKCYRQRSASVVDQNCTATNPGGPSSTDYVEMYRARVVVRWDEGAASAGENSYRMSSLIDPSEDATWNTAVKPFAYDDEVSISAGSPATPFAVVLNDSVEYNASGSVSPIVSLGSTTPAFGSVSVGSGSSINSVFFTPPGDTTKSGTVSFTYKVQGSSGEISADPATVQVHILPVATADTIFVEPGTSVTLNPEMLANDLGVDNISSTRFTSVVPVWDRNVDMFSTEDVSAATTAARNQDAINLSNNGITTSGGDVQFAAPATDGVSTTFYYYLVDDTTAPGGLRFPSAEAGSVTVTTRAVPLFVPDVTVDLEATSTDTWNPIDWQDLTGNTPDTTITIHRADGPAVDDDLLVRLDGTGNDTGALGTGEILEFLTQPGDLGPYELEYSVVSAGGNDSVNTGIMTIEITEPPPAPTAPVASGASTTIGRNDSRTLTPSELGSPTTGVRVTSLSGITTISGSCNSLRNPVANGGSIELSTSNQNRSGFCRFTYKLETTSGSPVLTSSTATVTVRVN